MMVEMTSIPATVSSKPSDIMRVREKVPCGCRELEGHRRRQRQRRRQREMRRRRPWEAWGVNRPHSLSCRKLYPIRTELHLRKPTTSDSDHHRHRRLPPSPSDPVPVPCFFRLGSAGEQMNSITKHGPERFWSFVMCLWAFLLDQNYVQWGVKACCMWCGD